MIVAHTLLIKRPIEDVFAAATNLPLSVAWRSAICGATQTSAGPLGVGATFSQEVEIMGTRRTNTAIVTKFDPPYCFAYELVAGFVHHATRFTLEPERDGTRFTMTVEGETVPVWLKLMREALMLRWAQNTVAQEMETFKELIESGAHRVEPVAV
jgi:uncharacterized protein YndB with AHSA1/START domain